MIQGTGEKDRVTIAVKEETAHITKMINEMSRFWDAKLVKLRQETDTFTLLRKIEEKADEGSLNEMMTLQVKKIDSLEEN